jgi:hypothetical protein
VGIVNNCQLEFLFFEEFRVGREFLIFVFVWSSEAFEKSKMGPKFRIVYQKMRELRGVREYEHSLQKTQSAAIPKKTN